MLPIRRKFAFTLIELLVVVAIITVLIAILVPALGKAKNAAKVGAVKAQMQGIARACEHYYTDFNAYPGPVDDRAIDGSVAYTGAQNLCMGLTRRFYPVKPTGGTPVPTVVAVAYAAITGGAAGGNIYFDTDSGKQMANYAVANPNGPITDVTATSPVPGIPFNTYSQYLSARSTEISTNTAFANTLIQSNPTGPDLNQVPCFVDAAFGSTAMPILYYRQNYKWDRENAAIGQANSTKLVGTPYATYACVDKYDGTGGTQACFYANTNILIGSGVPKSSQPTAAPAPNLDSMILNSSGAPPGGFVLVSAGLDRLYNTGDDIIVAGGL